MEKMHEVAAILGATFVPTKWHADEPALTDRGTLFFGDPGDWKTPQLFVRFGGWRNEGKIQVSPACGNWVDEAGIFRQERDLYQHLPRRGEIKVSLSRDTQAIAKDISRRILDGLAEEYAAAVQKYVEAQAVEQDRMGWLASIGLDTTNGRDTGTIWSHDGSWVSIDGSSSCGTTLSLRYLTRPQVEAVLKTLKEMQ